MRVRRGLARRVGPVLGVVLGPHRLAELAVFNAEAGRARARVVGGNKHLSRRVHGHVAGSRSRRISRGERLQRPVLRHAKARHFAGWLAVECIEFRSGKDELLEPVPRAVASHATFGIFAATPAGVSVPVSESQSYARIPLSPCEPMRTLVVACPCAATRRTSGAAIVATVAEAIFRNSRRVGCLITEAIVADYARRAPDGKKCGCLGLRSPLRIKPGRIGTRARGTARSESLCANPA